MDLRVVQDTQRGKAIVVFFGGIPFNAFEGETVAAALLANGCRTFRLDSSQRARGPYCNMGTCFECVVEARTSSGWRQVRACLTPVAAGLVLRSIAVVGSIGEDLDQRQ